MRHAGSLTEFLLARIAEDEADAQDWPVEGQWGKFDDARMWQDPNGRPIYAPRAKVLADCEAKRRIVNLMGYVLESWSANHGGSGRSLWPDVNRRERSHAHSILECLGSVYADHPDYRDEWRP